MTEIENLWTVTDVARFMGVSEDTARSSLSRMKVKALLYHRPPGADRPRAYYNPAEVKAKYAARPGQGARTDLKAPLGASGPEESPAGV